MRHVTTVVVGAGQAGLAMSHCLSERSIDHVVLERGDVAHSWRRQRWDSLRLLTPRWQSRLPGFRYAGPDPDGFMSMAEVVSYLSDYAQFARAPVEARTGVHAVTADGNGYRVATQRGDWHCRNVVLATGACSVAHVPAFASALPPAITQLTPLTYRNPAQLADGGVAATGSSSRSRKG
jgi:putative flavoprotein involved in K+ transport